MPEAAYWDVGWVNGAMLYERTLTDREQRLGGTHLDTLACRNNLSHAYQDGWTAGLGTSDLFLIRVLLHGRKRRYVPSELL
jgi:hypothetical protein